jgi:hypothetical protein
MIGGSISLVQISFFPPIFHLFFYRGPAIHHQIAFTGHVAFKKRSILSA